jgi:hypothetical protein
MTDLGVEGGRSSYRATGIKSEGRRNRRTKNDMGALRRALCEILEADVHAEIHFKRIAVLDEQTERWNLPLRPNKPGDSRTKKFHRQAGSVELDAIPARELRKLVRDCIEDHIDEDLLAALRSRQDGEQKYLKWWVPLFQQGNGWGLL